MNRCKWKKLIPRSLRHAMECCIANAKAEHNRSVEGIAELMGLENHWNVYKWMESGRMPAVLIPAFEAACGVDHVSRWLATRGGKLLIDMPTGRKLKPTDISNLQASLHETVSALLSFYAGNAEVEETLAAISNSMESLAWHKGNVSQHDQPQLELGDTNE